MTSRPLIAAIAFSAGLVVGLLIAPTAVATPRTAPEAMGLPTLFGAPLGPDRPLRATNGAPFLDPIGGATPGVTGANDTAVGPSPAATASPRPTATVGSAPEGASSVEVRRLATDAASVPATLHGQASWVRASLGYRYLAARLPKGTVLRICGSRGCVVRVVNDYGPSRRAFPERIVDLSRHDFAAICGDPVRLGTCAVRVTVR